MNKSPKNSLNHNDWSFVSPLFSAFTGVGIGLIIANYLGWF
jgi:hypothetical protein